MVPFVHRAGGSFIEPKVGEDPRNCKDIFWAYFVPNRPGVYLCFVKINKTNAARLLDKAGIEYGLIPYRVDEDDLSAAHLASELGEDVRQVFKTLVLRGERTGLFVCVVPGDSEVDLKKAARAAGDKKADLIPMKELLPATGYIRGGCSPIGMKKNLPTFVHETCKEFDRIYISAGVRGLQIKIAPADLLSYTGATVYDLVSD